MIASPVVSDPTPAQWHSHSAMVRLAMEVVGTTAMMVMRDREEARGYLSCPPLLDLLPLACYSRRP